ncbi:MAG: Gll4071 protein [uncultured Chthoniobacterales bacterium]|uniref:Gll4071 protein n=1 Tax=uncultured Chthoniobacterales bacterium TaxID=1836801 RepID=A0A6J4IQ40_9BACT|nr:MAG: Gll4071 protein [uncultured Chthoniobacterales bacterium]
MHYNPPVATTQQLTPASAAGSEGAHGVFTSDSKPPRAHAAALAEVMPQVYEELRRLAAAYLRGERAEHTLQPTALVHEAYLNLLGQSRVQWNDPGHFVGIFARVMRQTLRNHAVARSCVKRGGADRMRAMMEYYEHQQVDVSAIDEALEALEAQDERQARIVELRFFAGLSLEEIARVLGSSVATVKREWTIAKIWLRRELAGAA